MKHRETWRPRVEHFSISPIAGVSLYEAVYPPGFRMASHHHPFSNISMVLRGVMQERVGTRATGCHSGEPCQVVYKPAGTVHRDDFGTSGARIFTIAFHDSDEEETPLAGRVHAYRWERGGPTLGLMLRAWRACRYPDAASPLSVESIALELLDRVRPTRPGGNSDTRGPAPPWFRRALDVVHARFNEVIRVAEVAAEAGVHPVYLARVFRRRLRCTLGEYVRWLRLARALEAMRDKRATLAAVAAEAGFYDQPHFSRVFRQCLRSSPSEFRDLVRS